MECNDNNLNDNLNFPLDNNGENPFGLPQDYFSKFEDKLNKKLEMEDELKNFPFLSSIEKIKVFNVPDNYFKSLENTLEYDAELQPYYNLQSIKKPFFTDLDNEYKQNLETSINYKIEVTDELKPYEKLYSIEKINSFFVSENYFEGVSKKIKDKSYRVKENNQSVIEILLEIVFGKAMAFTLGLFLIIGISIFFYKTPGSIVEYGDCRTIACLERNEILNNKIITNFNEEQLIDLVDLNSLSKQLNSKKENILEDTKHNIDNISEDDILDEL